MASGVTAPRHSSTIVSQAIPAATCSSNIGDKDARAAEGECPVADGRIGHDKTSEFDGFHRFTSTTDQCELFNYIL
jgi:hypothetical protein